MNLNNSIKELIGRPHSFYIPYTHSNTSTSTAVVAVCNLKRFVVFDFHFINCFYRTVRKSRYMSHLNLVVDSPPSQLASDVFYYSATGWNYYYLYNSH